MRLNVPFQPINVYSNDNFSAPLIPIICQDKEEYLSYLFLTLSFPHQGTVSWNSGFWDYISMHMLQIFMIYRSAFHHRIIECNIVLTPTYKMIYHVCIIVYFHIIKVNTSVTEWEENIGLHCVRPYYITVVQF